MTHPGGAVLVETGVGGPEQVLIDHGVVNRSVADALDERDKTPGDIGLVINTLAAGQWRFAVRRQACLGL